MIKFLKPYLPITFIFLLASFTVVISINTKKDTSLETHPGFAEQFQMMKQNENGEIPAGMWKTWRNQSYKMRKAEFFASVKELGPTNIGGRARAVIVDNRNSERLIAGGVSGGIWISENSGASWTPLDDDASTLSITGITQSVFDPNIIYYSTGEVSNGTHVNYDGNGIFKSTDGGKSFNQLISTDGIAFYKTWDIEHSLTDSNTFYVATISSGLWRSTDGGKTIEQIHKSSADINDVDVMPDGTVYFTNEGAGLYRFKEQDTLVIERLSGNGLPTSGFGRCMVALAQNDTNTIYMSMGGSDRESLLGVYKSTDRAKSWKKLSNRSQTSYNQVWHNLLLEVHPTNANIVVMAGVTGEYSTNGGSTWKSLLNTHSDYHNACFVPNTNDFWVVSDGGIYKYNSSSASSNAVNGNGNFNITQLYAGSYFPESDGEKVIVGAQDNWTTVNTTGGSTFTQWLGGDGAFNGVSGDGEIIYASSQNGNIRRSRGGDSWTNIYNSLVSTVGASDFWFINPFELHPDNGNNIFFPTKNKVARSTNAGASWSAVTNNIPGNVFSVGITLEQNPTIYIGGQSSLLYRVKDANNASPGSEFKMFTLGPANSRGGFIGNIEIDPNDNTTIYLAMGNSSSLPRIWKVLNADTDAPEWVDISANLPSGLPVNWIEVDPKNSNHIMAATDYGLYISTNGGGWWEKETRIPNVYVSMIRLRHSDRKLFVFTFGRGVWVADLEDQIISNVAETKLKPLNVYPNPVVDVFTVPDVKTAKVQIIDISGKDVFNGQLSDGKLSTKNINNGTYFVKITESAGETRTQKVLIQH